MKFNRKNTTSVRNWKESEWRIKQSFGYALHCNFIALLNVAISESNPIKTTEKVRKKQLCCKCLGINYHGAQCQKTTISGTNSSGGNHYKVLHGSPRLFSIGNNESSTERITENFIKTSVKKKCCSNFLIVCHLPHDSKRDYFRQWVLSYHLSSVGSREHDDQDF